MNFASIKAHHVYVLQNINVQFGKSLVKMFVKFWFYLFFKLTQPFCNLYRIKS